MAVIELHVVPNGFGEWEVGECDDLKRESTTNHVIDEICFCEPKKVEYDNGNVVIVHNDDN